MILRARVLSDKLLDRCKRYDRLDNATRVPLIAVLACFNREPPRHLLDELGEGVNLSSDFLYAY